MAKLISNVDYLSNNKDKTHVLFNLNYIATREGVELNSFKNDKMLRALPPTTAYKKVSKSQLDLIDKILENIPGIKDEFIYEDFKKNANMYTASCFITEALENLVESGAPNKDYMKYIAQRPGVEKKESYHGLFDETGSANLEKINEELTNHESNVWRDTISLRREDAASLGFDNQQAFKDLLQKHMPELAMLMNIPLENFRWCAAFHNESYHPHVHLMFWSIKDHEGFCSKETLSNFKRTLINDVFSNELWLYEQFKHTKREKFETGIKNIFSSKEQSMIDTIYKRACNTIPDILKEDLKNLSDQLNFHGSKFYAYQNTDIKSSVDHIVAKIYSQDEIQPLMYKYLESQKLISSFYMQDGSKHMDHYMNEFVNHLIHPDKADRKVIHNLVLKSAYDLKEHNYINACLQGPTIAKLDSAIVECNMNDNTLIDNRLLKCIMKFQLAQGCTVDQTISIATNYINKSSAMRLYLEVQDDNDQKLTKKEIDILNRTFLSKNELKEEYISSDRTAFNCAHIVSNIINIITSNTSDNMKELRRLFAIRRIDEAQIKKSKMKNELRK